MHQDAFKPSPIKKMLVIITMLAMNALSQKYGNRIGPCSSLLQHRTIDVWVDSAMVRWRWCDSAMAMMRWRDNTMTMVQWHNKAIARRHDDTIAIAMTRWRDGAIVMMLCSIASSVLQFFIASSSLCHRAIALSTVLLIRHWKEKTQQAVNVCTDFIWEIDVIRLINNNVLQISLVRLANTINIQIVGK